MMKKLGVAVLLAVLVGVAPFCVAEDGVTRDEKAIEVLKSMSEYLASLDTFEITGTALEDADFGEGLIVTNPTEVKVRVVRPGSFHIRQFDGENTKDLFIHDGGLALYDARTGFYAKASVPEGLDAGFDFALDELGINLPLMDLVRSDVFDGLVQSSDSLMYLRNKNRVDGQDCHHLVIRTNGADIQLWVQEGKQPVPRRMIITSNWDAGSPRFYAIMNWNTDPKIEAGAFKFKAPKGASLIQFEPAN